MALWKEWGFTMRKLRGLDRTSQRLPVSSPGAGSWSSTLQANINRSWQTKSLHDLQAVIPLEFYFRQKKCVHDADLFYEWNKAVAFQYLPLRIICLLKSHDSNKLKTWCSSRVVNLIRQRCIFMVKREEGQLGWSILLKNWINIYTIKTLNMV